MSQPPGAFRLRHMTVADLDSVAELNRAAFDSPWSADLIRRELSNEWSSVVLVEEPGGQERMLLGFLVYWLVHDELHILNIATHPESRRRGVARFALSAALEQGVRHCCRLATLEVRKGNTPAIELYRAHGFRVVGTRPKYYADNGEDAVIMTRSLP